MTAGRRGTARGFTLVELVCTIVILGILSAVAVPKFVNVGAAGRSASIRALAASVTTGVKLTQAVIAVRGNGTASGVAQVTFVNIDGATPVRVWNGYPDRWCDGVGAVVQTNGPSGSGCYLSAAAITGDNYTFYGYNNSSIPNGDAGWRIENAQTPMQCSVQYTYNGAGVPVVTANTGGC